VIVASIHASISGANQIPELPVFIIDFQNIKSLG
jgi:hypothetical protein